MMTMNPKYYYALVWDSSLNDKNIVIKGEPLTSRSRLPEDPRMKYGTSHKDVFKVRLERFKKIVKYDVFTMKQSVEFIPEQEEIKITRDVRIAIWEGGDTMSPRYDSYRLISKEYFNELVKDAPGEFQINKHENDVVSRDSLWKAVPDPRKFLNRELQLLIERSRENAVN